MKNVTLHRGNALAILPTIADASVDFIFTDPSYGHNNNNGDLAHRWEAALGIGPHGKPRKILNDAPVTANKTFRAFLWHAARILRCCCCCCCCCCCGGGGPDPQFARWSLWMDELLAFRQMVVWDKGPMGMGWHYRRSYETVLVASKGRGKVNWYDTTHKIENVIRGIRKIIPNADQHPTMKPVALAEHFIRLHTKPGDLVLDPFMGSGTTGIAAVRNGRRFIGIELDPKWFRKAASSIRETA